MHGVGGNDDHESACADRHTAFGEEVAQPFHGAADSLLRGVFGRAEDFRNLVGGLALEVTQQQRVAIWFAQLAERGVEMRGDVFPDDVRFGGKQIIHDGGLLFASAAPHVGADGLRGDVLRGAMQPTGQHRTIRELGEVFRERDEHALSYIFREVRITNHPQRGGIDEIHMAAHQLGERWFGAVFRVGAQQL